MQLILSSLMQSRALQRSADARDAILRKRKQEERSAVAAGKKPFYLNVCILMDSKSSQGVYWLGVFFFELFLSVIMVYVPVG